MEPQQDRVKVQMLVIENWKFVVLGRPKFEGLEIDFYFLFLKDEPLENI